MIKHLNRRVLSIHCATPCYFDMVLMPDFKWLIGEPVQ